MLIYLNKPSNVEVLQRYFKVHSDGPSPGDLAMTRVTSTKVKPKVTKECAVCALITCICGRAVSQLTVQEDELISD